MTQGKDGISVAHRAALRCLAIARQLSVVTMVVSIAALVAGTAGTSDAKDRHTEDTVVVSNFGGLFAGSVETFAVGSDHNVHPSKKIKGPDTLLGAANGASGLAQSSTPDHEIAVALTLGLPLACPTDCHVNPTNGACSPRTQFDCTVGGTPGSVALFAQGATGDTAPEYLIDGGLAEILNNTIGGLADPVLLNATGLFLPQGVAFNNPFNFNDGNTASAPIVQGQEIFAVANLAPVIVGSTTDFITCGVTTLPTIGTITEYIVGDSGNIAPFPRFDNFDAENVVFKVPLPPATVNPPNPPSDLPIPYFGNATIGGCSTFLFLPQGIAFDSNNDLWVVNAGVDLGGGIVIPPFVSEFDPNAAFEGDASPIDLVGLAGATAGAFRAPLFIAVGPDPSFATADEFIFVTDGNAIKIFDVSTEFGGVQTGTISGGRTQLHRPEGLALSGDDLYVVNNNSNTLLMFDDFSTSGGNIKPKVKIKGHATGLDFPVGVALPQFAAIL